MNIKIKVLHHEDLFTDKAQLVLILDMFLLLNASISHFRSKDKGRETTFFWQYKKK
jgi:hypothetical protein